MFAVVLTGPPGVGKTATLTALSDALIDDQVAHAAVDVDEVAWAYPFPSLAQRCEHLRDWCASHRLAGHHVVVVSEVIESPAHLIDVLTSLGAEDHLLVRLEARVPTLRQRIIAREPPGWSGLDYLLDQARLLHGELARLGGVHLVMDTERLGPSQIAGDIRSTRPDKLMQVAALE